MSLGRILETAQQPRDSDLVTWGCDAGTTETLSAESMVVNIRPWAEPGRTCIQFRSVVVRPVTTMSTHNLISDVDPTPNHEVIRMEKTASSCGLCEDYARAQGTKLVAVLSCEGACLRGEISRQTANIVCHELMQRSTVRICLGGAFTKDTGQRGLVRNAKHVIALEGCPIDCASRMMHGVLPDVPIRVIRTDQLARFDKKLFGIDEMSHAEIRICAQEVARRVAEIVK